MKQLRAKTEKETRGHTSEGTSMLGRYPADGKKAAKMAAPARICCFFISQVYLRRGRATHTRFKKLSRLQFVTRFE